MSTVVLYLERTFDASHVIPNHPGKCARLHGHTYRVQAWLAGTPHTEDGMVVDFFDVKAEIDKWDHRHLNDEVDFIPTAELLVLDLHARLESIVAQRANGHEYGVLVRLWETPSGCAQAGMLPDGCEALV